MSNVLFVVPYALETTLRFVRSTAKLPGVKLGVIAQESARSLPEELREELACHRTVKDALDPEQLAVAVRAAGRELGGPVHRLLGILEQLQVPLAQVRERLGITGMSVEEARNFRDKAHMKDTLRQNDLPCARHCLAETVPQALAFAEECGFPLVVKPPAGAGAKNTFRVPGAKELSATLAAMPPRAGAPVLLEEFIVGEEHSFDSVSLDGKHLFHSISSYAPTPLEVMESPWIQWTVLLPRSIDGPEYADIRAAGPRALDALGMVTGMTHLEWFRRPDGSIAISEVAARPPGAQFTTLISYAHDLDFYAVWSELCVLDRFVPPGRPYAAGAAFLRGQGRATGERGAKGRRVAAVHGLEAAHRELGDLVVEARVPRPGQPAASSYEGEGYVVLRHPDTEVVRQGLSRVVELLRVELE